MKFYDITMKIEKDMMVYKNREEKRPKFKEASKGLVYETQLDFNLHTGTHLDFSKHILQDGQTSENFDISRLIRKVKVLDLTKIEDGIGKSDLINFEIDKDDFLLFKTANSFLSEFDFDFIYLKKDGAQYLADKGVAGVGIDALGIERSQPNHDTHKILFKHNVLIVEGINLEEVQAGEYYMIALPLRIENVEALPLRIILTEQ